MRTRGIQYIKIIGASVLVAIGIYYFWAPAQLAAGGISGLSIVISELLKKVPISVIVLSLDLILFSIGFFILGASFGLKSILSSLSIAGTMRIFELTTPKVMPISEDLLLLLIFGALFIAFGQAIIFREGASSGGTDIVAKIINKWSGLPIALSLFIADMTVVVLATNVFGLEKGLYAAFGVMLTTMMIDFFISGISVEKYVMIIPTSQAKSEAINTYILDDLQRGTTVYEAKGGYSKERKEVISTVVGRREFIKIKEYVRQIDEKAFVTVQNLHEVLGEGFRPKQ